MGGGPVIRKSWDQVIWLGAAIFDGARAFDGCAPDLALHCERAIRSAANLGLKSPTSAKEIEAILREGIRKFPHGTPLYLRPFMWAEKGGLVPVAESTRLVISLSVTPLPQPGPMSVCLTQYRRPRPRPPPRQGGRALCPGRPRPGRGAEAWVRRCRDARPRRVRRGVLRLQ